MSDSDDELELARRDTNALNARQARNALTAGIILIAVGAVLVVVGIVFANLRIIAGFGIWGIWFGLISCGSYWLARRHTNRGATAPLPRPDSSGEAADDWESDGI